MGTAASYWRSFANPSGLNATEPNPRPERISRARSNPSSVGLSFTRVSSFFFSSM